MKDFGAPYRVDCKNCGNSFAHSAKGHKRYYCSLDCQRAFYRKRHGVRGAYSGIAPGTVGAISELRVCVELMAMGFSVFRAQSPHCSVDLVVLCGTKCMRVAVKTSYLKHSGEVIIPKEPHPHDILALVLPDEIRYYDAQRLPLNIKGYLAIA